MLWMSGILGTLFVGIVALFYAYGLVPDPAGNPTLLSQLTEQVVGRSWFYYVVQGTTLLVLVLAANTSYADFPRLSAILARDDFIPHLFGFRGDRLAFSVGIIALSILAAVLLVLFQGSVDALIPLFAVGVFVAFTMSQAGMVVHWRRLRGARWRTKATINGLGALASATVALVAGGTKFVSGEPLFQVLGFDVRAGSWIVIVLIPFLILNFLAIHRHYKLAADELATETPLSPEAIQHIVVVPVAPSTAWQFRRSRMRARSPQTLSRFTYLTYPKRWRNFIRPGGSSARAIGFLSVSACALFAARIAL